MTFQAAQIDPQAFRTFDLATAYNNGQKVGNAIRDTQDDNALQQYHQENPDATSEQTLAWAYKNMAPRNADAQFERHSALEMLNQKRHKFMQEQGDNVMALTGKMWEAMRDQPPEQRIQTYNQFRSGLEQLHPEMAEMMPKDATRAIANIETFGKLSDAQTLSAQQAKRQEWQDKAEIELGQQNQHSLFTNSLPPSAEKQADWNHADATQQAGFDNQLQLKQMEVNNKQPPADFMTKGKSVMDLESALNQYRDLVKDYGTEIVPGKNKAALRSAYTNLQMKLKEALNLGVLNGPDLERIGSMITDPTSLGGVGQSVMNMGSNPYLTQIDEVATDLGNTRKNLESIYGRQIPQAAQGVSRALTKTGIDQRTGKQVTLILQNGQWVPQ